jgi:hypothetical protein
MAPKKRPSMLQRQRQLLQQQKQVKKASSTKLPPKGGTSAGSPKAGAQRLATAVKQKVQQDVTVTRALADNMRRNSERAARQIKPDPSPKVRYSGTGGPNPKPRNLPPVTKPVKGGSSSVTSGSGTAKATPPNTIRSPQTKGKPIPNTIKQNRPAPRGGALDKSGPTVDVKANTGGSTARRTGGSKPQLPSGSKTPTASSGPRGVGNPLPNSARRGGNLPRAGANAFRTRTADVRPATPTAPKPRSLQQPNGPVGPRLKIGGIKGAATAGRLGKAGLSSVALAAITGKAADTLGKAADMKQWERVQSELKQRQADFKAPKPQTAKPGQKGAVSPQQSAKTKSETVGSNKPTGTTGGKAPAAKRPEYKRPASTAKTPSAAVQATDKRDKKKLF